MPRKRTLSQAEEDSLNCALREPGISQSKAFKVWSVATGLSGLSRGVAQRLDESRLRPYQDLFAHGQCRALKPDKSSVSVHVLKVHRALQKMVKESNACRRCERVQFFALCSTWTKCTQGTCCQHMPF